MHVPAHEEAAMATSYPVTFDVTPPERYSRAQLALRVALFIVLGMLGLSLGALFLVLYIGLPVFTAVMLSSESSEQFLERVAPQLARVLRWVMAIYAYFALLDDRLPVAEPDGFIHLEIQTGGHPTVSSALLRILYGIPSLLVLLLLLWIAAIVWVIAFVLILVRERYPRSLFELQKGVQRWMVRLLAYQASIVEPYPPFSLGETPPPPVHASGEV
jgi:hypothetical protein